MPMDFHTMQLIDSCYYLARALLTSPLARLRAVWSPIIPLTKPTNKNKFNSSLNASSNSNLCQLMKVSIWLRPTWNKVLSSRKSPNRLTIHPNMPIYSIIMQSLNSLSSCSRSMPKSFSSIIKACPNSRLQRWHSSALYTSLSRESGNTSKQNLCILSSSHTQRLLEMRPPSPSMSFATL